MDIMIYDRYEFRKYKYILVIIDIHSRYVKARAMTNRENQTIIKNIDEILNEMGKPNSYHVITSLTRKNLLNIY